MHWDIHQETGTIAALATPLGKGGIAVIRISGEKTRFILSKIIERWTGGGIDKITPARSYHSFVTNGQKNIDQCMVVFHQAPRSYTGEDTAELSIHSNPFLVEEVLDLIFSLDPREIRSALPGEFTYRAFKNGKMDLVQAESVNQLIEANSRYYAHMTFGSLEGKLSRMMTQLKDELVALGVQIETKIEFEEEQFFDEIGIGKHLEAPLKRLDTLLANSRFNDLLNKGLEVVIVGKVNVGKSSLFNTLLMEERSIISDIPGTTRDFIKEQIFIDGFAIHLTDVAGINRETKDEIEAIGIQRSLDKLENCDAVIFMLDASRPLDHTDKDIYEKIKDKKKLIVINKEEIRDPHIWEDISAYFNAEEAEAISVKEHRNIEAVTGFLKDIISHIKEKETEFTVNRRQKQELEELRDVLRQVMAMVDVHTAQAEIIAEEIRRGIEIIGRLMGEITPDDILNKIFSEFCVGK